MKVWIREGVGSTQIKKDRGSQENPPKQPSPPKTNQPTKNKKLKSNQRKG